MRGKDGGGSTTSPASPMDPWISVESELEGSRGLEATPNGKLAGKGNLPRLSARVPLISPAGAVTQVQLWHQLGIYDGDFQSCNKSGNSGNSNSLFFSLPDFQIQKELELFRHLPNNAINFLARSAENRKALNRIRHP